METLTEKATIAVRNPVLGKTLYEIEEATDEQISAAYAKARSMESVIRAMSVEARIDEVLKINQYVLDNREMILDRIIAETGKSRMDAFAAEVFEVCDVIDHFKKVSAKVLADKTVSTPIFLMGKKSKVFLEPLGTVLVIAPWNFPFYQGIIP